jgi:ribose 5-phosphate isomerase B
MQLFLAADHAGFALKDRIKASLTKKGIKIIDLTPVFKDGDDYPLVAQKLTKAITSAGPQVRKSAVRGTRYEVRGLLFCGSGVGVCIAANRQKGIRAAVGFSPEEVKLAREHNDINVLCLAGWNHADETKATKLIDIFLKTKRSPAARHLRRVKQLG